MMTHNPKEAVAASKKNKKNHRDRGTIPEISVVIYLNANLKLHYLPVIMAKPALRYESL